MGPCCLNANRPGHGVPATCQQRLPITTHYVKLGTNRAPIGTERALMRSIGRFYAAVMRSHQGETTGAARAYRHPHGRRRSFSRPSDGAPLYIGARFRQFPAPIGAAPTVGGT